MYGKEKKLRGQRRALAIVTGEKREKQVKQKRCVKNVLPTIERGGGTLLSRIRTKKE